MIKQKFKKIVSLVSVAAAFSLTATSFFALNNNLTSSNIDHKSTSVQDDANSDNLATNYSNQSLQFKDDTYSEPDTPIGYLQVSQSNIYLVSWFGNQMWNYDVSKSPFLTQNEAAVTPITISKLNVIYLSNYNRVLVYGLINTNTSFVFQLNNDDGSEYYVNPSSANKVKESSLISSLNSNVIQNLNLINLLSLDTGIMISKTFDDNKLLCTKFSLENYSIVPTTYDITGSESTLSNITLDDVFGVMTNNTNTYIAIKGYSTSSDGAKKEVKLIIVKLTNNIYKYASIWTFTSVAINDFDINNAYFTFKTVFTSNGPRAYATMLKNDDDGDSYDSDTPNWTTSKLIFINPSNDDENVTSKDPTITSYDFYTGYPYFITQIYSNPNHSKVYLLLRKATDYSKYYLLDTSNTSASFTYDDFFTVSGISSSTKRASIHLRIVPETSKDGSINGIISIYSYGESDSIVTPSLTRFTLSKDATLSSKYNLNPTSWNATIINSFTNIPNEYQNYLPQDISLEFLKKYIYLKNIESSSSSQVDSSGSSSNLYDSTLTTDNTNNLTYDNSNGTVGGSVVLNLKKWWSTTSSSSTISIIVPISLKGLATTSDLSFSLVKSSDDNSTKWNNILSLQKAGFPSAVTTQNILDYFIQQGNKLNITTSDITIKPSTSTDDSATKTAIMVYTNDNNGTLRITYDLSSKNISPSITNTSGEYTYYNFKSKNAYAKITLNESAWESLKKSKATFQVTASDIISCLNLTSGYNTDASYWTWTPDASLTNNKETYINNSISGTLSGTIKYNKSMDSDASSVTETDSSLTISTSQASGFIKLTTLLGSNNTTSVYYNDAQASKIASSYSYEKVLTEFDNILSSSLLFYNNWTTSKYLTYKINSYDNNKITFTLDFKDNIITSIKDGNGNNLILDSDWIKVLKEKSNILTFANSLIFDYDLTNIVYSYGLSLDNNKITIDNLVKDAFNSDNLTEKYSDMLPYQFVESFYDSQKGSYDGFESAFNIIEIPSNSSAVNYYTVTSVQMVADDTNGTVTVFYTVSFPNSGSVVGSSSTASVVISGFKSTTAVANMWTVICASIGGAIGFATICLLCYFLITKFKYSRNRNKYGSGSTESDLNLETVNYRKNIYDNKAALKLRNTINKNTLAQRNNKKIRQGIRNYNKLQKEISKNR